MTEYSFKNLQILVNGVAINGFDDGDDVVQFRRRGDTFTDTVGADGNMQVNQSADRSGECILILQQTADANNYLMSLFDQQERGSFSALNIEFRDTRNFDKVTAVKGYIPKPADFVRGVNKNGQEWRFNIENLQQGFKTLQDSVPFTIIPTGL